MNYEDIEHNAKNAMKNVKDTFSDVSDAGHEMKKSGRDWLHYVTTHPVQSVFFGIVGYYALKGMLQD